MPKFASGSLQTIVAVVVAVGITYVVGVAIVMITFAWPVERLIRNLRERRLEYLRATELTANELGEDAISRELRLAFSTEPVPRKRLGTIEWLRHQARWWRPMLDRPGQFPTVNTELMMNIGRAELTDAQAHEYEYRRSVRQIASGVAPAVLLATAVGPLMDWSHWHVHGYWPAVLTATWLVCGLGSIAALMTATNYQERIAQWIILDTAYIYYRRQRALQEPGEETGHVDVS